MANENLKRLVELTATFNEKTEARITAENIYDMIFRPADLIAIGRATEFLKQHSKESKEYLAKGGEPTAEFLKNSLKAVDIAARMAGRITPIAELAKDMPDELKNDADIAALREEEFDALAIIAAYKPPAL